MSGNFESSHPQFTPSSGLQYGTTPELMQAYPFGFFVFPDGKVWARDPLQEANAGHDVDPREIDAALQMIEDDRNEDSYFLQ